MIASRNCTCFMQNIPDSYRFFQHLFYRLKISAIINSKWNRDRKRVRGEFQSYEISQSNGNMCGYDLFWLVILKCMRYSNVSFYPSCLWWILQLLLSQWINDILIITAQSTYWAKYLLDVQWILIYDMRKLY